ncbi:MAG: SdrD B-like domain-containing protein [Candidatus Eisenbacteria bacterium]
MKRLLQGVTSLLLLLTAAAAFAAVPDLRPMRGEAIKPRAFELRSLPQHDPLTPIVISKRRPEGINPAAEEAVERAKRNPKPPGADLLRSFTYDRTTGTRGFTAQALDPLAPTAGTGFEGISQGAYIPGEPTVAAGPLNIFTAGNSSVTVTNKDGSNRVEIDGQVFFGVPAAEGAISDAQCYYDALRGRFVALCFTWNNAPNLSNFYLAVSKTNDARGAWWQYKFDMTKDGTTQTSNWSDYQALGVSEDKIAMTGQQFTFANDTYMYQKIRVIDRAAVYAGQTVTYVDFANFAVPPGGDVDDNFVTKAARNLTAGDATIHLLCVRTAGGTRVTYRTITGSPASPTLSAGNLVSVASYSPPPDAVQKGSATLVPTNDCRPTDFYVRNGELVCSWHTANGSYSAIRLFRMRTSDRTVLTDETYGSTGTFYYYPAVTVDSVGTIFLGFDRSSSTEYPSSYATGKRRGDATLQSSVLLKAGVSATAHSRWGDYTGIDNDASASGPGGSTAWYTGQYTKGTNTFGAWASPLTFTYGQVAGSVSNDCDGSAGTTSDRTPLAGHLVTLKQGATTVATTTTDATGAYNFGWLESGTYDVVVAAPGGGASVGATAGTGGTTQSVVNAGDVQVNLTNAQTSTGNVFAVATSHAAPTANGIAPTVKSVGDAAFTLTVNGTDFVPCSVVRVDGNDRVTTYVSPTQVTAAIPATDLLSGGSRAITVFSPAPGGGTTAAQTLVVLGSPDTTPPSVTLTSPVGGESWGIGTSQNITWTATDDVAIAGVDLAYSTDGGATYPNAIATNIGNSGTYAWTVPSVPGANYRVRVTVRDGGNNTAADASAANFTVVGWTVTASAGAGGSIAPSGTTVVADGATPSYTITPATGYHVADVLVNGSSVGAVTNYAFAAIHSDQTIAASFAINTYTLTVNVVGSGTVAKSPDQATYTHGTAVQLTATPTPPFVFAGWSGDTTGTTNPVTIAMTGNKTITATFSQHTYVWNATSGSGAFGTATNWTPTRSTPATDDVLVFSNGGTPTVTGVATQTIGQLLVSGNTSVTLQAGSGNTLTIAGGAGNDLSIAAGSAIQVTGASALTLALATGTTGSISGAYNMAGGAHRLNALDAGSLVFQGGATCNLGTSFSGNAFGTGTGTSGLNSVVFANGSLLSQTAGANPFGASAPNSVVLFQAGSRFRVDGTGITPATAGRTYADFELASGGTVNATGASPFSFDSLIVSSGTLNLNLTGGGTIRGDIRVKSGATLGFAPSSSTPSITLAGTANQTVYVNGTFSSGTVPKLVVNNPAGVTLANSITWSGPLQFTSGVIHTGSNTLALASTSVVTGAAAGTGWVHGKFQRSVAASGGTTSYDVGGAATYAPVSVTLTGNAAAVVLVASSTDGDHPSLGSAPLNPARSVNRFWTLTPVGSPAFTSWSATMNFAAGDLDAGTNTAALLPALYSGSWTLSTVGTRTATSTQGSGMTVFGDITAAEAPGFTITASAGPNGSITPSGAVSVSANGNQSFAIAADAGFAIADVLVDAVSVGAVTNYAFTNVTANHTIAASFADATAPSVAVTAPNGGENLLVGASASLTWTASDNVGVTAVDLELSRDGGANYTPVATGIANTGTYGWTVTGPSTAQALLRVTAHDAAGHTTSDASDAVFSISGSTAVDGGAVTAFALGTIAPNPTRGAAQSYFALPREASVRVSVMDVQGREAAVLADGVFAAGRHSVTLDAQQHRLVAGLYFVRLRVNGGPTLTKRFAVTR